MATNTASAVEFGRKVRTGSLGAVLEAIEVPPAQPDPTEIDAGSVMLYRGQCDDESESRRRRDHFARGLGIDQAGEIGASTTALVQRIIEPSDRLASEGGR